MRTVGFIEEIVCKKMKVEAEREKERERERGRESWRNDENGRTVERHSFYSIYFCNRSTFLSRERKFVQFDAWKEKKKARREIEKKSIYYDYLSVRMILLWHVKKNYIHKKYTYTNIIISRYGPIEENIIIPANRSSSSSSSSSSLSSSCVGLASSTMS